MLERLRLREGAIFEKVTGKIRGRQIQKTEYFSAHFHTVLQRHSWLYDMLQKRLANQTRLFLRAANAPSNYWHICTHEKMSRLNSILLFWLR